MTIYLHSNRPAKAAIAAVLALSSTAVLAQEVVAPPVAGTAVAPPPAAAEPAPSPALAPAATATPVMAPAAPVVQQTASVEARIADAVAKAEAEKAAVPAPRRVAQATPAARQPAAPRLAAPVSAPAANTAEAPVPQPTPALNAPISRVETAPPAQPAPAPAPTQATAASDSDNRGIVLGLGGAALLLAGFAGTALTMRRRRQVHETVVYDEAVSVTPAVAAATPVYTQPVAMPPVAPVVAQPQGAPLTDLDAMIAAPPSPENPFLTHAKRKRRAMALLREREEGVADALPASSTPVVATAQNQVDRSQTVYSFGKVGGRRKDWVPGIG